jgi:hypothetical protein
VRACVRFFVALVLPRYRLGDRSKGRTWNLTECLQTSNKPGKREVVIALACSAVQTDIESYQGVP